MIFWLVGCILISLKHFDFRTGMAHWKWLTCVFPLPFDYVLIEVVSYSNKLAKTYQFGAEDLTTPLRSSYNIIR